MAIPEYFTLSQLYSYNYTLAATRTIKSQSTEVRAGCATRHDVIRNSTSYDSIHCFSIFMMRRHALGFDAMQYVIVFGARLAQRLTMIEDYPDTYQDNRLYNFNGVHVSFLMTPQEKIIFSHP